MADRYPGGVISKTPPTVTPPVAGEGGSASGVWTLDTVLEYEKAGAWPKPLLPRELYAWGANASGQLGLNDTASRSSPVQIGALVNWEQVAGGNTFSAAIKTDGTLWTWGEGEDGRTGHGNEVDKSSPVQVGSLTNWAQVAAGERHSAAVKTDGTLWTWGDNAAGKLGDGTVVDRSSPVQIGALTTWYQVAAGDSHTASIKTDGTMWTWGGNYQGQLGINSVISRSSPVQVGSLTNWSQVSIGAQGGHTAAVKTDGTMWAWGRNSLDGPLGDGTRINRSSPVQIGALTNWSRVAGGNNHTVAVKTDGTIWTWGNNSNGQLGDGTVVSRSSPVQIGALTTWDQLGAGTESTAAIKTDGTFWSWGKNNEGQLGQSLNTSVRRSSPVQVGVSTNWFKVSCGNEHTLATTKG